MGTGTNSTVKAALYGRVSTSGHGQDVEMQMEELRLVAAQRGWKVVGEFVDNGFSGSKDSRPALDQMMKAARDGKINLVAVWKFDRFARSTQHLLTALEEFARVGVQFVSLRESIDTGTPIGRMVFTLVAAISEFERDIIKERVQAGVDRARAAGKHCGRPRVGIDLRAASILLGQGHSVREVASMLGLPRTSLVRRLRETCHEQGSRGGPQVSL